MYCTQSWGGCPNTYTPRMPTSPGPLLQALTTLWNRLREGVPDLPMVLPVISPTPQRQDHGPERWTREDNDAVSGLVVSATVLQAGAEATVEFVLHEAAHVLSWQRSIKDTTMRGIYHNQQFLAAAEEVGLQWPAGAERTKGRGFDRPVISDATRARFASDVQALSEAIPLLLPHLTVPTPPLARPGRLTMVCQCDPPRKIRAAKTVAALGPISCGVCGAEFVEE